MATVVNNPPPSNNSSVLIGVIVIIVLFILAYVGYLYGLPALKQMSSGNTQINVPNKIDVKVHESKDQSGY